MEAKNAMEGFKLTEGRQGEVGVRVPVSLPSWKELRDSQDNKRNREPRAVSHPAPSCLPSKGLPLRCPPAKVHSSPTTIRQGLSPPPTPKPGPVLSHPSNWGATREVFGLASWPEPARGESNWSLA